ncbi:hypothetical protein BH20BAC1_BH20BAC1_24810 [soil metagenome]
MKKTSKDFLKFMDPNKMAGDAQRMLKSAVDVLEEEIAAGILAAKKLEKKVINVEEVRGDNPTELMSRIRRDTHDAIDIILDAVTVLVNQFSNLSDTVTRARENGTPENKADHIPVVKNDEPVKAGNQIEIPILLSNDSIDQPMTVELNKSDLTGPGGNKILARNISLVPRLVVVDPAGKREVAIRIKIPKACISGSYSGLMQDRQNQNIRTVIMIDVE